MQDEAGLAQALLGPGLILAFALHGVWALHASAIVREGEALAFLAESGVGKSTLASALCDDTCSGYRLLADDVLPISLAADGARVWPHFPQLKLDRTAQPGPGAPESLPLDACYLLQLGGEGPAEKRAESVHAATLAFVRHTIAARLFGPDLLGRHLRFCEALARRVPLHRLAYDHSRGALAEARRLVTGEHSACSVLLGSA
ncbi:MAG: hypothetical protein JXA74_09045 [Anaerolineae bacterium]|nr:hypothetical protein [Anaerolineae bacterium]